MRDSQATNNAAKRSRVKQASLAGIIAMAGSVGVPALTSASPNHPLAVGKVTVVGTNTFTIVDRKGVTTVVNVTPGTTTYLERGVTAPSFANIGIGDEIAVQGTLSAGIVSATAVMIEVPPVLRTPLPEVHGAPLPGIQYGSSGTTTSLPGGSLGNGVHGGFGDGLQNRHANR